VDFRQRAPTYDQLFKFLSLSAAGRRTIDAFIPRFVKREIRILHMKPDSLGADGVDGTPAGGFIFDGRGRRIYVDRDEELGLQAPLLFHEMVHSLDEEYITSFGMSEKLWANLRTRSQALLRLVAYRKGKPAEEILGSDLEPAELDELARLKARCQTHDHRRIFRAERKAYAALAELTAELSRLVPGYADFLTEKRGEGHILDRPVTDAEIVVGYRLNPAYLQP
jgi:hypothetical protein